MSWTGWLGGLGGTTNEQSREVEKCVRKPQPKVKARQSSSSTAARDSTREPRSQVPSVVVDFTEMSEPGAEPVYVHVYDLGNQFVNHWKTQKVRSYNPFHTGVEVCGSEFSFGLSVSTGFAEIVCYVPKRNMDHHHKSTLFMGYTSVPPREVLTAIKVMESDWNNNTFSWKSRNCHNFTDAICERLGVNRLERWLLQDQISTGLVFLRVYNLGQTFITRWHNSVNHAYGAYHTGVEIYEREWAFGVPMDGCSSAIGFCSPGECPEHDFRQRLYMGTIEISPKEVEAIIEDMRLEWTGDKYDMFKRNCHNFSEAFCKRLGVFSPQTWPTWINDLAGALAAEDEATDQAQQARLVRPGT